MDSPTHREVANVRLRVQSYYDLSKTGAREICAYLVHSSVRAWRQWEAGERTMHPAFWELLHIKTNKLRLTPAIIHGNRPKLPLPDIHDGKGKINEQSNQAT